MEPRVSLITLGVDDLDRAVRFYEALGLRRHPKFVQGVAFFQLNAVVLSLFPRADLARDADVDADPAGFSGVTLAYNTRSEAEVDALLKAAAEAGGRIVKPAARAFWGGWSGYFADTEGHLWEVAFNAEFGFDERGGLVLPE